MTPFDGTYHPPAPGDGKPHPAPPARHAPPAGLQRAALAAVLAASAATHAQPIGTDITNLNLCLYGEAAGQPRTLPGFELHLRTRTVRLAAAVDLKRALGIPGLAHGAARAVKDAERVTEALRGVGAREVVIAIRGVEDAGT